MFSHPVNVGTNDTQAPVGEGQRRPILDSLPSPICSKDPLVSPKNVYDEKVSLVLNLAWGHTLVDVWDAMRSRPEAARCLLVCPGGADGRRLCIGTVSRAATFFTKQHFHLKK